MQTTIFGPPGTGKTTKLISIVKQELEDGTRPEDIAFVSFSRKAADEARTRASSALNMNPDEMVWFRTLHSLAFQFLGISRKQVLRGTDFRQLGDILGLEFSSNSSLNMAVPMSVGSITMLHEIRTVCLMIIAASAWDALEKSVAICMMISISSFPQM